MFVSKNELIAARNLLIHTVYKLKTNETCKHKQSTFKRMEITYNEYSPEMLV